MSKRLWSIIGSILTILAFAGGVWGISSFWHNYCSEEDMHEFAQATEIKEVNETALLAMQQSSLVIAQQRAGWLEQQLVYYERTHGCVEHQPSGSCVDRIWRTYQNYLLEYKELQKAIRKQMGN